ncbi:MAG: hypothetical protein M1828_001020 [Chrysothrix sp. TS-e1954]|nr:MAG: hypothetical protein M1828_001020 [Chrysothrix sp. TS-e1954]
MGSYVFKWEHPASEVHVTGTFDNWSKSVELKKENGAFQKMVSLPSADEDVYYKFVVDDKWITDHTAPSEKDSLGNVNNVLRARDIEKIPTGARSTAGEHNGTVAGGMMMSGMGAGSSTAQMAGNVPLEKDKDDGHIPGAFPDAPSRNETGEAGTHYPVELYPGDIVPDYSTYTSATHNTSSQTPPASSKGEQSFGVSPLPATAGTSNPISTQPGEKLPPSDAYTSNDINSHVKTDKESYEKSDAYPSGGEGAYGAPPVLNTMIPESSLSITSGAEKAADPTISSTAGTNTSMHALAGQVPLEKDRVPDVVKDSQEEANEPIEATKSTDAVADKSEVEKELKEKVPEQPAASDNKGLIGGAAAAGAGMLGGAAAYAAGVPASIQKAISDMNSSSDTSSAAAAGVPETVKESQSAADTGAEASANPEAVSEKKAMESELTSQVKPTDEAGEPAPTTSAATAATAPGDPVIEDENTAAAIAAAHDGHEPNTSEQPSSPTGLASGAAAGTAAAAVAAPVGAVAGSKAVEDSSSTSNPNEKVDAFKSDPITAPGASTTTTTTSPAPTSTPEAFNSDPISPSDTHGGSPSTDPTATASAGTSALNAPATTPATTATPTTPQKADPVAPTKASPRTGEDSRDVSPMSKGPAVTTGVGGSSTPQKSGWQKGSGKEENVTPSSSKTGTTGTPASAGGAAGAGGGGGGASKEEKKKNRRSFFGKIKDKINKH